MFSFVLNENFSLPCYGLFSVSPNLLTHLSPHSLYAIEFVRIPVNREQRDLKTVHVENR